MTTKATDGARAVLAGEGIVGQDALNRRSLMPWPASIVVADTMALAQACVGAVGEGNPPQLFTIMGTDRATILVGSHVPDEVCPAIVSIVRGDHDRALLAQEVWRMVVAPRVIVVDLPIGEYLRPEIQVVWRGVAGRKLRADISDLPTIALAAFLAPAVIWSRDRIFTRTGLAAPDAADTGYHLTTLSVAESVAADIVITTACTSIAVSKGMAGAVRGIYHRPLVAGVALLSAALLDHFLPDHTRLRWRKSFGAFSRAAGGTLVALVEIVNELQTHRSAALVSLAAYDAPGWRRRTALELCAIMLARSEAPMTVTELWGRLGSEVSCEMPQSLSDLRRDLVAHPAFTSVGADRWRLGMPASQVRCASNPDRAVDVVVIAGAT